VPVSETFCGLSIALSVIERIPASFGEVCASDNARDIQRHRSGVGNSNRQRLTDAPDQLAAEAQTES
jgi:hypothetical protein